MGDRVLFQVVGDPDPSKPGKPTFSPVLYCHWSGSEAPKIVDRLRKRMMEGVGARTGDVDYTFARLVQEAIDGDPGNLSFGVWNATHIIGKKDSHGDAGVVQIDVSNGGWRVNAAGGYLAGTRDGSKLVERPADAPELS